MHDFCPVCGLQFEREQGYFLGAMIIDYALGVVLVSILTLVLWACTSWTFETTVMAAILLFLPAVPTFTRFGRILWIYFDQAVDPEED